MRALTKLQTLLLLCFIPISALAEPIRQGAALPPLAIDEKGELIINGDDIEYKPWSTAGFKNKVVFLQYMAARPSADKMNRHVINALTEAAFPVGSMHTAVLVNLDDVTFGASSWALRELGKNKIKHPRTSIIADYNGKGLEFWGLQAKSSAIGVVGKNGQILFFKDGALSQQELETVISLIQKEIKG
jgi:YtfJ family uncharacterized protein